MSLTRWQRELKLHRDAQSELFINQWCQLSKVDFNAPSIDHTTDFLMHLFQERNLQPSIMDVHKTAIVDRVGNSSLKPFS